MVSINGPGGLLTLKLVCKSHQRWETFILNLGTLGLQVRVIQHVRNGRMDRQTDGQTKATAYLPHSYRRGIITEHSTKLQKQTNGFHRKCS